MDDIRIIIALSNESQSIAMKNLLAENGYNEVYIAKDGQDCLRRARLLKPDLAILDFELPSYTGHEVAKILEEDGICGAVLIANEGQRSLINEFKSQRDLTCLIKPISRSTLINTIDLIVRSNKKIKSLEKQVQELKETLETRKLVEQAKGIIMKEYGITEQEAFRKIQKQSMDKGIPVKEIAKAIIIAYDGVK